MNDKLVLERLDHIERLLRRQTEKPLTLEEACEYLCLSKGFVYKLTSSGLISHYKPNNKKIYFTKADLDAYLLRHRVKSNSEVDEAATDAM